MLCEYFNTVFSVYDLPIQSNINATKLYKNDNLISDFIDFIGFYYIWLLAVEIYGYFILFESFYIHPDICLYFFPFPKNLVIIS